MKLFYILILVTIVIPSEANQRLEKPMNIIFFLVDDLGWKDLGCYGSSFYETPNADRLAQKGVRFTQAYAACHVCSPTRASILTGKYPARLHLTDWISGRREFDFQQLKNAEKRQHLPFDEVTLAEYLKKYHYNTAIFGKWHLGENPSGPTSHGFDSHIPHWNKGWPRSGYYAPFNLDGLKDSPNDYLTDRLTDEALQFIETNKDQSFFLYLSLFSVHDPIQGRSDLVEKYRKKLLNLEASKNQPFILEGNPDDPIPRTRSELESYVDKPEFSQHRVLPHRTVKIKQHQDNIHFAAMVEAMDENLGRVMTKLDELDIDKNTIIVFFSDNGGMSAANFGNPKRIIPDDQLDRAYSTSNLPLRGAKGWLYEGGVRVPLIIYWPGKGLHGVTCNTPVISTDFYPTLIEMVGMKPNPTQHVDGVSLVPALMGNPIDRDAIYWHFPHYSNHGMQSPCGAIRKGPYKLIEYFENNNVQLFNLETDLSEQVDLKNKEPQKARELLNQLQQWRVDVHAYMPSEK